MSTLKGKKNAPKGSKFFYFRVDIFPEGNQTILTELAVRKIYELPLNSNDFNILLGN